MQAQGGTQGGLIGKQESPPRRVRHRVGLWGQRTDTGLSEGQDSDSNQPAQERDGETSEGIEEHRDLVVRILIRPCIGVSYTTTGRACSKNASSLCGAYGKRRRASASHRWGRPS